MIAEVLDLVPEPATVAGPGEHEPFVITEAAAVVTWRPRGAPACC